MNKKGKSEIKISIVILVVCILVLTILVPAKTNTTIAHLSYDKIIDNTLLTLEIDEVETIGYDEKSVDHIKEYIKNTTFSRIKNGTFNASGKYIALCYKHTNIYGFKEYVVKVYFEI